MSIAEFAILLVLYLLLLAVLVPRMGGGHDAPKAATRADLSTLQTILAVFHDDCSRYPTTREGLNALFTCPTNLTSWRGPYIKDETLRKDPWGHPYIYSCPGIHNTNGFDLYSCGRDGISRSKGSDPDDINNWTSLQHR
jgi:general secretion pathway protein G